MEQLLRYTRYKLLYMLYRGGLVHAQLQCERIQFKSHCGRLCLSRMPLQYAALGTGCVYLYCSLRVSSALHPSGVAKSSTSFSGNVTSAGWQVTLCDPMWHVSSRSGVAVLHCKRLYPYTVRVIRMRTGRTTASQSIQQAPCAARHSSVSVEI